VNSSLYPSAKLLIFAPSNAASMGSQQDRDPRPRGAGGHDNYCDLASNSPRGVSLFSPLPKMEMTSTSKKKDSHYIPKAL
jgi:hypothetical protein